MLKLPGIDWERRRAAAPLPIIRVGLSERRELVELLEHMRRERENKAVGWELNLKGLLINFLTMYSRLISSLPDHECRQDERGYCGYIYAVLKFVEENYTRDITGADIAEFVGLSQDYLSRQFKAAMAMTPVEYVRKFRVAKSIDLLKTTDMSIANIADACGFGDISLYSRVFKQIIGVSPAAFRKE